MAQTKLNMLLQVRRDNIFTSTYVLQAGEPGFEISTNTFKVGDGTTTWANLPIANKAQIDALIKVTDDKLAGYKTLQTVINAVETAANTFVDTVAQDANGKITITTKAVDFSAADDRFKKLQTAVAAVATAKNVFVEQIAQDAQGVITITTKAVDFSDYRTAADQDAIDATFALKTDVATEFAKYTTTTAQQAIDAEQDRRLGLIETELDTHGDIVTHNVAEFATAAQGAKADAAAVKTEVDAAFLLKADKSVVDAMYTNAQIDQLVQGAKDYADTNDANTEYHVEYDSTNKKIKLVAGADASKMEIDATDFIKDGMIDNVTIGDDNDLVITFNTAAGKDDIRLPLDQLVDIYTGSTGDRIVVTVASDKSISAELVAGSISKNYLDTGVQTSLGKADSALQAADLADYAKTADVVTNDEFTAFEATNSKAISDAEAAAKTYADGKFITSIEPGSGDDGKIYYTVNGKQHSAQLFTQSWLDSIDITKENAEKALEGIDEIKENLGTQPIWDDDGTTKPLSFRDYIDQQDAATLQAAKDYADGLDHEDTTYTFAPTAAELEFTVDPNGKGTVQTVKLVAPTVDTGVMEVAAGNDIVVTPGENGKVTVSHKEYATGNLTKDPAELESGDAYVFTGLTLSNGHVESGSMKSVKDILEAMTFVLDGGTSAT